MQGAGDVLRSPERFEIGKPGVHLGGRFAARRILEHHPDFVDGYLLHRLIDDLGRRQNAHIAAGDSLTTSTWPYGLFGKMSP